MAISFNTITTGLKVPLFYAEIDASQSGSVSDETGPTLLTGQMLSTGTATADEIVPVTSVAQAKTLFGAGSQLAHMCERYLANDPSGVLYAAGVADPSGGTQATGTIVVDDTDAAGANGTISIYIAGRLVEVAVTEGDTAAEMATAILVALAGEADLPVTPAGGTEAYKVDLTAKHKGTIGNQIDIRINYLGASGGEALPTDVVLTIPTLSGGAEAADYSGVVANMADERYDTIVVGDYVSTVIDDVLAEVADRWSPLRQVYGHCFVGYSGTYSASVSAAANYNSQFLTVVGATACPNPPWELASAVAGQAAASLRIDPARPCQTLGLTGILAPADRWTTVERNNLAVLGISSTYVAGGSVRITSLLTTYVEDALGNPSTAYADIQTGYTLARILRRMKGRIETKYPRHKLASDGTRYGAGQAIVTPSVIRGELISVYRELESEGLVEGIDAFKTNLLVERNTSNRNRIDVLLSPDLTNQLRVFAMLLQFRV